MGSDFGDGIVFLFNSIVSGWVDELKWWIGVFGGDNYFVFIKIW